MYPTRSGYWYKLPSVARSIVGRISGGKVCRVVFSR